MNKEQREEHAKLIVNNDVFNNATSLVNRALNSNGDWTDAGYSYDNVSNLYQEDDYGEMVPQEICQWFHVSNMLGELLEKNNYIVLNTVDGYYWGRTGYGYSLHLDFMPIVEKLMA